MGKIWIIARHDYLVNLRRPGFIIMTALVPALGAIALLIGAFFSGQAGAALEQAFGGAPVTGVVDESGYFTPLLPEFRERYPVYPDEQSARAAVERGDLRRALIIPPDYMETGQVRVITGEGSFASLDIQDSSALRRFFVAHLAQNEPDPARRARLIDPVDPVVVSVNEGQASPGGVLGSILGFIVPYMLSILLVVTIFVSSGYLLRSVSEEKTSRVIEIVLSSVSAQQLLAGKVIGLGALGLTQVLVWILSSFALSGGMVGLLGVAIPLFARPMIFLLAVVYYALGFTVYAVLMGSVGALGANMQESQQLAGIFSLLASVPLMLAGVLFTNPNAPVIRVLSWFPLTAPTAMMLRLPMTDVPTVDIVGSIAMILISTPLFVWVGAKIFRLGLLMYGKRPSVREIVRLLREA